jgi:hypothetical protein
LDFLCFHSFIGWKLKKTVKTALLGGSILMFEELSMKNVFKAFGIIALVAVIGFYFTACSDDGGGGGGGDDGTLTVTNIPSKYNGKYAWAEVLLDATYYDYEIFGVESISVENGTGKGVKISNGSVSIPMWVYKEGDSFSRYSDNGTHSVAIGVVNQQNAPLGEKTPGSFAQLTTVLGFFDDGIAFKRGGATVSWNKARIVEDD